MPQGQVLGSPQRLRMASLASMNTFAGRMGGRSAKMISSLSFVGGAEVSAPALQHSQHKEFEYKHKREFGCLGGCTSVTMEDEGDDAPPFAMRAARKRSKLEHDHKVGKVAVTLDRRTLNDLCGIAVLCRKGGCATGG